jgi:hypothetical protein
MVDGNATAFIRPSQNHRLQTNGSLLKLMLNCKQF